jgi:hypothetical protein
MRFNGGRHGRRRLAGADYYGATARRNRRIRQPGRQAMRRIGRSHGGIEQFAQKCALSGITYCHGFSQPKESSVRPLGLYSQPTQPP